MKLLKVYHVDIHVSSDYTHCMDKKKQTTMRFTPQDMEAIARIRELYGCISDTAAVRLAISLVAKQEQTPPITPRKERRFHPHG